MPTVPSVGFRLIADVEAVLFIHPMALAVALVMLGNIKIEMAIVALHQVRCPFWPKPIRLQMAFGIRNLEAFDESFGIGAELAAFGDHRP